VCVHACVCFAGAGARWVGGWAGWGGCSFVVDLHLCPVCTVPPHTPANAVGMQYSRVYRRVTRGFCIGPFTWPAATQLNSAVEVVVGSVLNMFGTRHKRSFTPIQSLFTYVYCMPVSSGGGFRKLTRGMRNIKRDGNPPVGSRGIVSPVRVLGDEVSQNLKHTQCLWGSGNGKN